MRKAQPILQSRLARRVFVLFLVCALLPISLLAGVSYWRASLQVYADAESRLAQDVKSVGMSVYERLELATSELRLTVSSQPGANQRTVAEKSRLLSLERGPLADLMSKGLSPPQMEHLAAGKTVVEFAPDPGGNASARIMHAVDPADLPAGVWVGEIDPEYLWSQPGGGFLGIDSMLLVLDEGGRVLHATRPDLVDSVRRVASNGASGSTSALIEGSEHFVRFWSLPLAFAFAAPDLRIIVALPYAAADGLVAPLRRLYLLLAVLTFCAVTLLSVRQIRSRLRPIEQLREGTERLTAGDLDARVEITSDDEFADLGESFNQMADTLGGLVTELDSMRSGALIALARTVDAKSSWTRGHTERVTAVGVRIGKHLGLGPDVVDLLHRGGLLHDIGKIGVPNAVLDKPGRLTAEEFDLVKLHPVIGARILRPIDAYADVIPIVEQHHERFDGKGYPYGLTGEQMTLESRIMAVADVFDACRSDRPYRDGMPLAKVVSIITEGSGSQFDPEVVAAFLEIMELEGDAAWRAASDSSEIMSGAAAHEATPGDRKREAA